MWVPADAVLQERHRLHIPAVHGAVGHRTCDVGGEAVGAAAHKRVARVPHRDTAVHPRNRQEVRPSQRLVILS
eukprot:21148-Eustigmatos_ZCMA.PRE.1